MRAERIASTAQLRDEPPFAPSIQPTNENDGSEVDPQARIDTLPRPWVR